MVKIGLQLKARLEGGVTDLLTADDFRWHVKVKCTNCGEQPDKWQYVTMTDKMPVKVSKTRPSGQGRSEASLVIKCKLCSRENTLDVLEGTTSAYQAKDDGQFKTVVVLECRGIEPVDFSPRDGWSARGDESGTKFMDVDLSENEWVDYDERTKESVGIYEVTHQFVRM